jgi:transposase
VPLPRSAHAADLPFVRRLGVCFRTVQRYATASLDDLPALHTLAAGLRRDHAAVTLPCSSGAVEGQVNRVKARKRARYGRANLDLLRQRILIPH